MTQQVVTSHQICLLFNDVPPHARRSGIVAGHKSTWTTRVSMLTLNRPGNYPQSGNTTILTDKEENPSFIVTKFTNIWNQFDEHAHLVLSPQAKRNGNGFYGAASVTFNIDSGEEQTLTVILSLERDISRLSNPIQSLQKKIR